MRLISWTLRSGSEHVVDNISEHLQTNVVLSDERETATQFTVELADPMWRTRSVMLSNLGFESSSSWWTFVSGATENFIEWALQRFPTKF
jgi:hypothetical protein